MISNILAAVIEKGNLILPESIRTYMPDGSYIMTASLSSAFLVCTEKVFQELEQNLNMLDVNQSWVRKLIRLYQAYAWDVQKKNDVISVPEKLMTFRQLHRQRLEVELLPETYQTERISYLFVCLPEKIPDDTSESIERQLLKGKNL